MQDERVFQIAFFMIERCTPEHPRFLVYGRTFEVDSKTYLGHLDNKDVEERIPLAGTEKGSRWVPIELIVRRVSLTAKEHDDLLENLKSGLFNLPLTGPEKERGGFSVTPRHEVIQLDANSAQCNRLLPRPESGLSSIARVESFWPKDNGEIIVSALDPMPETAELLKSPYLAGQRKVEENPFIIEAEREFDKRLQLLVEEMTRLTGLSFRGAYAERLCNIESLVVPFNPHIAGSPFTVIVNLEERDNRTPTSHGVCIRRNLNLVSEEVSVHVVLRNGGDVLVDRLVPLPEGQLESEPILAKEVISEYEVEVFGAQPNAELIFSESHYLVRTIIGTGLVQSGTKTYRDKLAAKLSAVKSGIGERLATATPFSPTTIMSGGHADDPWVQAAQRLRQLVGIHTGLATKACKWFPRGLGEQGEVIEYIRELIDRPHNRQVLIADPFFGITAFGLIIPRLRNSGLQLTVLTSCLGWDPDIQEAGSRNSQWEGESAKQRDDIASWCEQNSALIEPSLTIVDIQSAGNQAFHDRYMACVSDEGAVSVYSISSSLNKLAGKYPCCITELEESVARQVYSYIRGLESGHEISWTSSGPGKKLDRIVVWDAANWRNQQRAKLFQRSRISDDGPPSFEFWRPMLSWLLELQTDEEDRIVAAAAERGFTHCETGKPGEWFVPESFYALLKQAWMRLPDTVSSQAKVLGGLGEFLAHAHGEGDRTFQVVECIGWQGRSLDVKAILSCLESHYREIPPPSGFKGRAPTVEELSAMTHLTEEGPPCFRLLSAAENYLDTHYEARALGLYGLRWVIRMFLTIEPGSVMTWAESARANSAQIGAAIVSSLVETIVAANDCTIDEDLLHSERSFLKMLGVASIFWKEKKDEKRSLSDVQAAVIGKLRMRRLPEGDILWISALNISTAQAAEFRTRGLSLEDSRRQSAEKELGNLLAALSTILARVQPSEFQFDQLDQALRLSSRDRYSVAEGAQTRSADLAKGPWDVLYGRCIADVEVLIGRSPGAAFSFFAETDFDKLDVGAQSFVRLNSGKIAKRLRSRFQTYLEGLVLDASAPFARERNYEAWSQAVGRAAAGSLFTFLVCQHALKRGEEDNLARTVDYLFATTCQLFLGARGKWFDLGGLLDRLAREAAWTVGSIGGEAALQIGNRAIDDERILPFFRGCLACVPRVLFEYNPSRALALLDLHTDQKYDRNTARYFYLLDFVLGNGHLFGFERKQLDLAIRKGLDSFPNLPAHWHEFFMNVLDALEGDKEKKALILKRDDTAHSYCGTLLALDVRNA